MFGSKAKHLKKTNKLKAHLHLVTYCIVFSYLKIFLLLTELGLLKKQSKIILKPFFQKESYLQKEKLCI